MLPPRGDDGRRVVGESSDLSSVHFFVHNPEEAVRSDSKDQRREWASSLTFPFMQLTKMLRYKYNNKRRRPSLSNCKRYRLMMRFGNFKPNTIGQVLQPYMESIIWRDF